METAFERANHLNDGQPAQLAEIQLTPGGQAFVGIVLRPSLMCQLDLGYFTDLEVSGFNPVALTVDEHAVGVVEEMHWLCKGHCWKIQEIAPDGEGFTSMQLRHEGPYRYVPADADLATLGVVYGLTDNGSYASGANPDSLAYPFTVDYMDKWGQAPNAALNTLELADVVPGVLAAVAAAASSTDPKTARFIEAFRDATGQ